MVDLLVYTNHRMVDMYYNTRVECTGNNDNGLVIVLVAICTGNIKTCCFESYGISTSKYHAFVSSA
jgi:hypothetical protein